MIRLKSKKNIWLVGVLVLIPMLFAFKAGAYVMSSDNYRLEKDSINIGGTENGSSENYKLRDTLGEIGTGTSTSENFIMNAGYRQMDETYLAMAVADDINLSPNLGGLTGGQADGSGIWNVKTDSAAGYSLSLKASSTPALHSGDNFLADYTPATPGTPDRVWNLDGANSEFGFSPYNALSQPAKFKNDASVCSAGNTVTDGACWYGFSTSYETVAYKTSRTALEGEDTKINFKAEIDGFQTAGTYQAQVVVTAASN